MTDLVAAGREGRHRPAADRARGRQPADRRPAAGRRGGGGRRTGRLCGGHGLGPAGGQDGPAAKPARVGRQRQHGDPRAAGRLLAVPNIDPLDPHETGITEEFRGKGVQTTADGKVYSGRLLRLVTAEPNLKLRLKTHVTGVEVAPWLWLVSRPRRGRRPKGLTGSGKPAVREWLGRETGHNRPRKIAAVLAVDVPTGRRLASRRNVFIDCSGDAVVGVAAGAEYRQGRESQETYGESMAPQIGDQRTMGNSPICFPSPSGGFPNLRIEERPPVITRRRCRKRLQGTCESPLIFIWSQTSEPDKYFSEKWNVFVPNLICYFTESPGTFLQQKFSLFHPQFL